MKESQAGSFRHIAAATYDGLLVAGLLMLVTALLLPLTHGEGITQANVGAWQYLYTAFVLAAIGLYFGLCWTGRGQTLGMKAWDIRLETSDGRAPSWSRVVLRLACAIPIHVTLVAGVLLYLAHRSGWPTVLGCATPVLVSYGWHALTGRGTIPDRISGTRVVIVARPPQAA